MNDSMAALAVSYLYLSLSSLLFFSFQVDARQARAPGKQMAARKK